jgi:hypothetical protein
MKQKIRRKRKHLPPQTILRLPDLEVARSAVLNSPPALMLNAATGS